MKTRKALWEICRFCHQCWCFVRHFPFNTCKWQKRKKQCYSPQFAVVTFVLDGFSFSDNVPRELGDIWSPWLDVPAKGRVRGSWRLTKRKARQRRKWGTREWPENVWAGIRGGHSAEDQCLKNKQRYLKSIISSGDFPLSCVGRESLQHPIRLPIPHQPHWNIWGIIWSQLLRK